jgi:hypothetical protein
LEIAAELKLSLEIPRQIQHLLEKDQLLEAFHLSLLFGKKLTSVGKSYKWTFLRNSGQDLDEASISIVASLLSFCEEAMESIETSAQVLYLKVYLNCLTVNLYTILQGLVPHSTY